MSPETDPTGLSPHLVFLPVKRDCSFSTAWAHSRNWYVKAQSRHRCRDYRGGARRRCKSRSRLTNWFPCWLTTRRRGIALPPPLQLLSPLVFGSLLSPLSKKDSERREDDPEHDALSQCVKLFSAVQQKLSACVRSSGNHHKKEPRDDDVIVEPRFRVSILLTDAGGRTHCDWECSVTEENVVVDRSGRFSFRTVAQLATRNRRRDVDQFSFAELTEDSVGLVVLGPTQEPVVAFLV